MMSAQTNVIFGTGPLGLAVMDELVARGETAILVNRSGQLKETLPSGVTIKAGDANNSDTVAEICQSAQAVYICAMPPYTNWPQAFPPLIESIIQGISRTQAKLIFGDNLYMYGPTNGEPIQEDLPYNATGHKGKTRAKIAQMLLNAHKVGKVKVTIGRASDFYGPRVINSILGAMFFSAAFAGKPANVLGNIDLPHTYSYIADFGKGLVTLGKDDRALGQAWHIPNSPTISTRQFTDLIAEEIGQPIKLRPAGKTIITILGIFNPIIRETKEMMYAWEAPYIVDHSRFKEAFGNGATPHKTAIKETVAWYRQYLAQKQS